MCSARSSGISASSRWVTAPRTSRRRCGAASESDDAIGAILLQFTRVPSQIDMNWMGMVKGATLHLTVHNKNGWGEFDG